MENKGMICSYCGSDQHTAKNCRSRWDGQGKRLKLHCTYCGMFSNHTTECCPRHPHGQANREKPEHYDNYVLD